MNIFVWAVGLFCHSHYQDITSTPGVQSNTGKYGTGTRVQYAVNINMSYPQYAPPAGSSKQP